MTDYELAKLFGVSESTINNWKEKYPEFAEALTACKSFADERVVRSLYHRAIGYTYDTEEVFLRSRPQKKDKNGKVIRQAGTEVIRVAIPKHVPPDVTAGIFWLKNRRPDEWRDVKNIDVGVANMKKMSIEELQKSILDDIKEMRASGLLPEVIEGQYEEVVTQVSGELEAPAGVAPKPEK